MNIYPPVPGELLMQTPKPSLLPGSFPVRGIAVLLFLVLVVTVSSVPPICQAQDTGKARLEVPVISADKDQLIIVSRLKDSFSSELIRTIESGKQVIFTFYIELFRSRFSIFFPDDKLWRGEVTHAVTYDTATRKYEVVFASAAEKNSKYTENPDEMKEMMGRLSFPLPAMIDRRNSKKEHYARIRVKADTGQLPGGFQTKTIYSKKFIPAKVTQTETEEP